jgi:glycosyltransferase involved in cell wall biosynthesis
MKISGCVIVKNEEENIAQCINNIKNVADEIILVDTGSEDNTVQIAKELGANVYEHQWENDFSKAKNIALEHATGDWIIFLDADEYFHEDSLHKVRPVIQRAHDNHYTEGIFCGIVHIDIETKGIISKEEVLRIFRNNKQFRFINTIHEEIRNKGIPLRCISARDELTIMHTGYSASVKVSKAKRNLEMLLRNKDDEKSAYYLATTYFSLQDYDNAYKYADLALSVKAVTEYDYLAYKMHFIKIIITMAHESSNKEKIRLLIDEAKIKYGNHPEIAGIEANYLLREKHFIKSLEKYLYALECQEGYGNTYVQNNFPGNIDEVYYNIALILYLMNKEADALSYYVRSLQSNKYHPSAFNAVFVLCRTLPETETIAFLNSIYDLENEEDVKFIISRIADCGRPKIVLYYASKWNNTFSHEDDVLIYAYISQCNYFNALEIALLYLKVDKDTYSPLVTSVILLGRLFSEADKLKDDINSDYYDLIKCYAENRDYSGDTGTYILVFTRLIKYSGQFNIDEYLKLGIKLGVNTIRSIAEVFLADFQFDKTIYYLKMLFELNENEDMKAADAYKAGYCYYKLKKYPESVNWFEKAKLSGYVENDLSEYLQWIAGQSTEAEVRRKAQVLLA